MLAHLVFGLADRQPRRAGRHQKDRDALALGRLRVGHGPDHKDAGIFSAGDVDLRAVEHIMRAIFPRLHPHARRVGARAAFGQAEGPGRIGSVRQLRQVFALLRIGAAGLDDLAHHVRHRNRDGRGGAGIAKLLDGQRKRHRASFGAAILRLDIQRGKAVFGQELEVGEQIGATIPPVERGSKWGQPVGCQFPRRVADHLFFVGQGKMHRTCLVIDAILDRTSKGCNAHGAAAKQSFKQSCFPLVSSPAAQRAGKGIQHTRFVHCRSPSRAFGTPGMTPERHAFCKQ